jgi:periplasmic copper chaperone A
MTPSASRGDRPVRTARTRRRCLRVARPTAWVTAVLALSACFAVTAPAASAHGGPIALTVLAADATGPLQSLLRVQAAWASDGHGIDGLGLRVEGNGPGTTRGSMDSRGSGVYEATLTYPRSGDWQLTVSVVDGPADVAWSAAPLVVAQTVRDVPRASGPILVVPGSVPRNSHSVLTFAVPNARRDGNLIRVELVFPAEQPLLNATVRAVPGWIATVARTTLDPPIGNTTERVGSITWTATNGGLVPGEFDLFTVSVGPLPKTGRSLTVPTIQTYDTGEVVSWNETRSAGAGVPRYPAPVVRLGRAASTSASGGGHR